MNPVMKTWRTGLYGENALRELDLVISRMAQKHYDSIYDARRYLRVVRLFTGEIAVEVHLTYDKYSIQFMKSMLADDTLLPMDGPVFRRWISRATKLFTKRKVGDLFIARLCSALEGNFEAVPKSMAPGIIGQPLDPAAAEFERVKIEALAEIESAACDRAEAVRRTYSTMYLNSELEKAMIEKLASISEEQARASKKILESLAA